MEIVVQVVIVEVEGNSADVEQVEQVVDSTRVGIVVQVEQMVTMVTAGNGSATVEQMEQVV